MTVILIDGNNALWRFGIAMRTLMTEKGVYTGAIHGLLSTLLRLKHKYEDAKFVVVWDGPAYRKNSWRKKYLPTYKDKPHVEQTPELTGISNQFSTLKQILSMLCIPQAVLDELECDDLIGMLAKQFLDNQWQPIIYSSDKDYLQLMSQGVQVIRDVKKPSTLKFEDAHTVFELFKCELRNILKVRAICGDESDRISGIQRGLGPVRANKIAVSEKMWQSSLSMYPALSVNYRIMRIVCDASDTELPKGQQLSATQELARIQAILLGKIKLPVYDRRIVFETLAELELNELLGKREELLNLRH